VVIAGGGPTGMMLAAELTLAGVDAVIVERRLTQELDGSRAGGLHPRTLEVFDQRGIVERFVSEGERHPIAGFALTQLDITDFPTRHNYVLALWQSHIERIMSAWIDELGVQTLRGREVEGFAQSDSGVDVSISDGSTLRAEYLVGCDGGRSVVRKTAGIEFVGEDASTSWMIAEVEMDVEPEFGIRHDDTGMHAIGRRAEGEPIRIVLTERSIDHATEPTIDELRDELHGVYGTDFGLRSASWISRFTDMTRQAAEYRRNRVLLAGDAAHVHPPQGGQGLGTGVQDAVNLGWKLAQVVQHISPDDLLDTYHVERHPVGARVLRNTRAQVALNTRDPRHQALYEITAELLAMDEPRRRIGAMMTALDVHYDFGEGHPLLGRRMPDLDVQTSDGLTRVYSLLHTARPVLLNLGAPAAFDIEPWGGRVRVVDAHYDGVWELPVIGEVAAPGSVLIRPDGHVAWTGNATDADLQGALTRWFGVAAES